VAAATADDSVVFIDYVNGTVDDVAVWMRL
jgi:hypothetical protein